MSDAAEEIDAPWSPCHRLIASRYPTTGPFDGIAAPADVDAVLAIEGLTNPRLRQELGQVSLVPPQDRVVGPGAALLMAPFCHPNPAGSRFGDGRFGLYYAGESLETAAAEVGHHRARFLAHTHEPAIDLDLRWVVATPVARWVDLRGRQDALRAVYDPDDYAAGQSLGRRLRAQGRHGVVYDSVRRAGGQCLAAFKPTALTQARVQGHVGMRWNGTRITHWYVKGDPQPLP